MMGGCIEATENKFSIILCVHIHINSRLKGIALIMQREAPFHPLASGALGVVLTQHVLVTWAHFTCAL